MSCIQKFCLLCSMYKLYGENRTSNLQCLSLRTQSCRLVFKQRANVAHALTDGGEIYSL